MNNEKYITPTTILLTSIIFMLITDNYAINLLAGFCIPLTIIHIYLSYVEDKLLYETKVARTITLLKYYMITVIVGIIFTFKYNSPDTNLFLGGMLISTILMLVIIQLKRRVGN